MTILFLSNATVTKVKERQVKVNGDDKTCLDLEIKEDFYLKKDKDGKNVYGKNYFNVTLWDKQADALKDKIQAETWHEKQKVLEGTKVNVIGHFLLSNKREYEKDGVTKEYYSNDSFRIIDFKIVSNGKLNSTPVRSDLPEDF